MFEGSSKMEFHNGINAYLKGDKFSNALAVKISTREISIPLRMDYIEELVYNKNIIHLGCADHIPLIKQKIQKNTWFHKRLVESTNKCLGIDISREGVEYIQKELGYSDVIQCDILTDEIPPQLKEYHWDFIIMGEIVEHIDNPVEFLHQTKLRYAQFIDRIIISVPNASKIGNFKRVFRDLELINSDHRYWFTPYTLAKVASRAGLTIESFQFCQGHKIPRHYVISKFLAKRYPGFRDTLVMVLRF